MKDRFKWLQIIIIIIISIIIIIIIIISSSSSSSSNNQLNLYFMTALTDDDDDDDDDYFVFVYRIVWRMMERNDIGKMETRSPEVLFSHMSDRCPQSYSSFKPFQNENIWSTAAGNFTL